MIYSLLLLVLSQAATPVRNPGPGDGGTLLNVNISAGASTSWAPDGGPIGSVTVTNFPAPDGGFLGSVTVTNFPQPDGGFIGIVSITGNVGVTQITSPWQVQATNLDVALSTRTKPSDQQHVLVDQSDGGVTYDVTGSSVRIGGDVSVMPLRPNPFTPRCNPVRRTGCLP